MKRITMALLLAFSLAPAAARADTAAHNDDLGFYFAPEIGYVLPTAGNVDDTVFLGGRAGYDIDPNWAVELESGWMRLGYDVRNGPQNQDIDVVPILANLRYNGDRCDPNDPGWYLFGGLGADINSLGSGPVNVDDSFAWQFGGGADLPFSNGIDGFIDARYLWNRPHVSVDSVFLDRADIPDHAKLQTVMFTVGVKF